MRDGLADYVRHVYQLTLRLTGDAHRAEDLTQETFLRAWQKHKQLNDERATRVWLFRIAANLWSDQLRRKRSGANIAPTIPRTEPREAMRSAERELEDREDVEQALQLLDMLPARQRAVLYLTAVEDLSLNEVCAVLEINKNTAKVNLSHARKRMRDELAKLTNHHA